MVKQSNATKCQKDMELEQLSASIHQKHKELKGGKGANKGPLSLIQMLPCLSLKGSFLDLCTLLGYPNNLSESQPEQG